MQVDFYNFKKRDNSTLQPAFRDPTKKTLQNVQLKDECSFLNPVLLISPNISGSLFSPALYNYAAIPYWQRYYFINDWTWKNGVWECSLTVDVLASFKGQISNTIAYVERSASAYDGEIMDNYYPAKADYSVIRTSVASSWQGVAPNGGTYVIGCINNVSANRIGSVTYYACTPSQLNSLLAYLYSDSIYQSSGISEITEGLFKSLFNPMQYIVSCIWFPFRDDAFGSHAANISIGYWLTDISATVCNNVAQTSHVTCLIPKHPQSATRGNYLNYGPYTRHTLYCPPFGNIPIDTSFIDDNHRYLYSQVFIDNITGEATIKISTNENITNNVFSRIQTERTAMIGVPIQIAQVMVDGEKGIHGILNTISGIATLNAGQLLSGVTDALVSQVPQVISKGSNGSFITELSAPVLISQFANIIDNNNTEWGRPLCADIQLGTLSGFIKCADSDHEFLCTDNERKQINAYLKNGFFFE